MQRRKFIQKVAHLLPTLWYSPLLLTACQTKEGMGKKVIVIGAGISGLAAAQRLQQTGFSVRVLEAQDRVGGRLRTNRTLGVAFDEGASWIHGINGNPITTLAQQAGMQTFHTVDTDRKSYDLGGKVRSAQAYDAAEDELYTILDKLMRSGSPTQSFEQVFNARYPQYAQDRLWRFLLSTYVTFDTGDLDKLSSLLYNEGEEYGGIETIATNGYDTLAKHLSYASAAAMLRAAAPHFRDTLPKTCKTDYPFQKRVGPWLRGKLPILEHPREGLRAQPLTALNTETGDEANPVRSADGQELYFSGAGRPDNVAPGPDVFVALRTDTGWAKPTVVPAFANRDAVLPLSLTADGRWLLVQVNEKLALSERRAGIWQSPQPLVLDGLRRIWRGCLSADGRVLVVEGAYSVGTAADPPDVDLFAYVCDSTGRWGKPIALGADINTDENEGNPYLSADQRTLYFTTNGYPGLGDSDVFMATRTSEKWTTWTRPANLGKEINDTFSHHGVGDVRAGRAIFAKYLRDSATGDLWETTLPQHLPPPPSLGK